MQLVDDRLTVGRALMKSDQLILDPAQAAGQLAQARAIRAGRRSGRLLVHFAHGCHLTHPDTSQKACLTRWNGTSPDYCRKSGISRGGASGLDSEVSLSEGRARHSAVRPWCSGVRGGPMEYPDHLKMPVRKRGPGSADLGDVLADELLWDAASWNPDVQPPVPAMPGGESAEGAERLGNGGPEPAYRALGRLARLGVLPSPRWPHVWPTAGRPGTSPPGPSRPGDPWPPSGPAAGPAPAPPRGGEGGLQTPRGRLVCLQR